MKNTILVLFVMISTSCFAQGEITVAYVSQAEDFIAVGLSMDKPTSKFELIDIDTLTLTDNKGNVLKENREYPLNYNYNNGRGKEIRFYPPKKRARKIHIKGALKYFRPTAENESYFDLGKNGTIPRNVNLVNKELLAKNPELYFSIVDSTEINKVFPDFRYKMKDSEPYRKIDFGFFDIIYAYRYTDEQKLVYFIDNDPMPGYNNLTLRDKKTGIMYNLTKLKAGISPSEVAEVHVEIMIENEASIERIPFDFDNVPIELL